jgi:hypothetical protein
VCRCTCGKKTIPHGDALKSGATKSCGCLQRELTAARSIKHGNAIGYKSSPELKAYHHAKSRCTNPNDEKYKVYGARGIRMCDEWMNDAGAFLRYMGPRPKGCTLDRIRVHGDYEPGNVRWATSKQQGNNRQDSILVVTEDNQVMTLKEFAETHGYNYKSVWAKRKRGLSLRESIR